MFLVLLLSACGFGTASPPSGPVALGPAEQRVSTPMFRFDASRPPEPDPAIGPDHCSQLQSGGPLLDDCLTATIQCGETIVGHTRGGVNRYDSDFYRRNFCTPDTTNHDSGDERIYRLDMPAGDRRAFITLDSPCADLDVSAMLWNDDTCPLPAHSLPRCEMWPKDGTRREHVELVSQKATTWWIVVEGRDQQEGAFALSVQCEEGLH